MKDIEEKVMTQEEKAKRFDEVLAMAKECITYVPDNAVNQYLLDMFPELKESEDERIRGNLIELFHDTVSNDEIFSDYGLDKTEVLAWLEKQGKEKSWKPSKEEMDVLYGLAYITNQYNEHKEEVITRLYQDLKREFFNGSSYENMFPNTSTEDDVRRRSTIQVLEYARSLDTYNQYGKADIDKNIAWLEKQGQTFTKKDVDDAYLKGVCDAKSELEKQGEQNHCMIQWKGDNLKEVIDFTGKDKNFEKWFKSFEEYEKYVQEHDGIFKLFNADGSHYEVPVGAWIVKTPDGYNVASKAIFRQKFVDTPKFKVEQTTAWSEDDKDLMYNTLSNLTELKDRYGDGYGNVGKCIDWLKSLKERVQPQNTWKPSGEQILALRWILNNIPYNRHKEEISGLLEQLKKLKE